MNIFLFVSHNPTKIILTVMTESSFENLDTKLEGRQGFCLRSGSTCSGSQSNVEEVRAVERPPWAMLLWALAFSIGGGHSGTHTHLHKCTGL